jgi:thiamine biosynthesis lipoprotein
MGTDVEFIIRIPTHEQKDSVGDAIERARARVHGLEQLLSRFRRDSDISRINHAPGSWVEVTADTLEILRIAQERFHQTHGFFNPFLGQVLEVLGYERTFEEAVRAARSRPWRDTRFVAPVRSPLHIDTRRSRVLIESGYQLDLGGIAKGWIIEQAARVLRAHGIENYVCNGGGDLVCHGTDDGRPWTVGITNPFDPSQSLFNLDVINLAVATSGTYVRTWRLGDTLVHHLIDPFEGKPVETDVVSCTVLHRSLVQAEVLAKVALILGSSEGAAWLSRQSISGFVMVRTDGEVIRSCNLSTNGSTSLSL